MTHGTYESKEMTEGVSALFESRLYESVIKQMCRFRVKKGRGRVGMSIHRC